MEEEKMRKKLSAYLRGKSQRKAAQELGISPQYLNDIVLKRRSIWAPAILKKFGFKRVVTIEKNKP